MEKESGQSVWVELLRPLAWIEAAGARPGQSIRLELYEFGAVGKARVLALGRCPEIEAGSGTVVTGTFRHQADENSHVVNLRLEGEAEPTGVTDNHPYWSVDRSTFVPVGKLQVGERVNTTTGPRRIASITPRKYADFLHNFETTEHVYRVAALGVLVHNACATVYHYTDKKGWNAIRSQGNKAVFKASKPLSGNPAGAYFTTKSPSEIGNKAKRMIGVTSSKFKYFFKVNVPRSSLKRLPGGRGNHVVYSAKDVLAEIIEHGKNPVAK